MLLKLIFNIKLLLYEKNGKSDVIRFDTLLSFSRALFSDSSIEAMDKKEKKRVSINKEQTQIFSILIFFLNRVRRYFV